MANQGGSHGQNVKAGQQGKNQSAQQASGASHSSGKGAQGGSHEQHVKAGQQSHKKGH
jgi:hypothetical protein